MKSNTTIRSRRQLIKAGIYTAAGAAASGVCLPGVAQENILRLVVPYPPGGGSDLAARIVAPALAAKLGKTVVVENVSGAGGRVGMQNVKRMADQSDVLVLVNPALMVVAPLVYKDIGYDPDKDFKPVTQITSYEFAAAVSTAVPVKEMTHLVAWLKANPEKATMGVPAAGSLPHFFALMVGKAANVQAQVVGYRGSAPLLTDLVGGHIPVALDALETLQPQHDAGKLRILATSGEKRSVANIPTFKEAGYKLSAQGWNIFYAKSQMPDAKVAQYAQAISEIMATPAVKEQFTKAKAEPVSSSLAKTKETVTAFKQYWEPVVKNAGLKFD
jgi:tripartite-type tricarboxylate transporter receptor subunit TctC